MKQATKAEQTNPLYSNSKDYVKDLSELLATQFFKENLEKKLAGTKAVLELVGMGVFTATSFPMLESKRTFLKRLKYYYQDAPEPWRRFNIPYLKRTLTRLEKQKLVETFTNKDVQMVKITEEGRQRVLKYSLDTLEIAKPKRWDGIWRLISYDIPESSRSFREQIPDYLKKWGFYQLHESVYLHAYPCEKEVEFLREYLQLGEYVRIFEVKKIENDQPFRDFFDI